MRRINTERDANLSDALSIDRAIGVPLEGRLERLECVARGLASDDRIREQAPEAVNVAENVLAGCAALRRYIAGGKTRAAAACALEVGAWAAECFGWELIEGKRRAQTRGKVNAQKAKSTRLGASKKARARAIELAATIPAGRNQAAQITRQLAQEHINRETKEPYPVQTVRRWIAPK